MDKSLVVNVKWPRPWRALEDEYAALAFGRRWAKVQIADTVLGELRREICNDHPLLGRECIAVAYDADCPKEFLLLTDLPDAPVVLVHLTWHKESKPDWPFIKKYKSIDDFIQQERRHRKRWWQFWV
jgi:hypothetical protein